MPPPTESPSLARARAVLATPRRRRPGLRVALACALLMAVAAVALCAVVLLGGWTPTGEDAAGEVRGSLSR